MTAWVPGPAPARAAGRLSSDGAAGLGTVRPAPGAAGPCGAVGDRAKSWRRAGPATAARVKTPGLVGWSDGPGPGSLAGGGARLSASRGSNCTTGRAGPAGARPSGGACGPDQFDSSAACSARTPPANAASGRQAPVRDRMACSIVRCCHAAASASLPPKAAPSGGAGRLVATDPASPGARPSPHNRGGAGPPPTRWIPRPR